MNAAKSNLAKAKEKCKEPELKINRPVYSEDINFVKLQDFKRKVYLVGVYDDPLY